MVNLVHLKRNRRRYFHAGITTGRAAPLLSAPSSQLEGRNFPVIVATNRTSQTLTSIVGQPLICSRRNVFFRKENARTHLPHKLPRRGLRPEPHRPASSQRIQKLDDGLWVFPFWFFKLLPYMAWSAV
jgi:hypothetical protein